AAVAVLLVAVGIVRRLVPAEERTEPAELRAQLSSLGSDQEKQGEAAQESPQFHSPAALPEERRAGRISDLCCPAGHHESRCAVAARTKPPFPREAAPKAAVRPGGQRGKYRMLAWADSECTTLPARLTNSHDVAGLCSRLLHRNR